MIYSILMVLCWGFIAFGMIGLFKFKTFYGRLLNNALIDSVAVILLFAALIIKSGYTAMSVKLGVIGLFFLITNPVISQMIAHSAHRNTAMEDENHDVD